MNLLYFELLCAVVVAAVLVGVMTVMTPKKGFEVLGDGRMWPPGRIAVKCNRCGRVQLQRKNQTCVQCGNIEVKKK